MLYKQMQNTYKTCKNTHNSKTCTKMQQTYQTNDKNMKKTTICCTNKCKITYTNIKTHLQTIVKHVQKMQHTYQTNEQKHQNMTNTICCNNTCKKNIQKCQKQQTIETHVQQMQQTY